MVVVVTVLRARASPDTDNMDGTSGEQPRGTVIDNNLCHELGQLIPLQPLQ